MRLILSVVASLAFFALGCELTNTKWERDFADYKISEKTKQDAERERWSARLDALDSRLADARRAESLARAELDGMRDRVAQLERDAKTAEARWSARLAKLAVRQSELLDRAEVALEFCAGVLK